MTVSPTLLKLVLTPVVSQACLPMTKITLLTGREDPNPTLRRRNQLHSCLFNFQSLSRFSFINCIPNEEMLHK